MLSLLLEQFAVPFPDSYLAFLEHYDGGQGAIGPGSNMVYILSIRELLDAHDAWEVNECMPGHILFGTDYGDFGLLFDTLAPVPEEGKEVRWGTMDRVDHHGRKVRADIAEFGWHVVLVLEDEEGPPFAYSIGLQHSFGHPEIIMFGLRHESMHGIINWIGEMRIPQGQGYNYADMVYDNGSILPLVYELKPVSYQSGYRQALAKAQLAGYCTLLGGIPGNQWIPSTRGSLTRRTPPSG